MNLQINKVEGILKVTMAVELSACKTDGTFVPKLVKKLFAYDMMNDFLRSDFLPDLKGYSIADQPFSCPSPSHLVLWLQKVLDSRKTAEEVYSEHLQLQQALQTALSRWLDWVVMVTRLISDKISNIKSIKEILHD